MSVPESGAKVQVEWVKIWLDTNFLASKCRRISTGRRVGDERPDRRISKGYRRRSLDGQTAGDVALYPVRLRKTEGLTPRCSSVTTISFPRTRRVCCYDTAAQKQEKHKLSYLFIVFNYLRYFICRPTDIWHHYLHAKKKTVVKLRICHFVGRYLG